MSEFEYFHGFEAILFGLAFALLFSAAGKMIIHSRNVRFYWIHIATVLLCFFILVELYYDSYFYQFLYVESSMIPSKWHFFFIKVMPIGVLYLLIMVLFPGSYETRVDFKELFQARDRKVLALILLFILLITVRHMILVFRGMSLEEAYQTEIFYVTVVPNSIFALLSAFALLKKDNHRFIVILLVTALVFVLILMSSPAVVPSRAF